MMYSLVIDATGKTAAEVHKMHPNDIYLTARLRERFLKKLYGGDGGGTQKPP